MSTNTHRIAGRHFLQIPGPSPVPDRILRAMNRQIIDHRGPEFQRLGQKVIAGIKPIFKTTGPVFIFPASGTGAWEAALSNTLSPGDMILMFETGHFAALWRNLFAVKLGLVPEFIESDWRSPVDASAIEEAEGRYHTHDQSRLRRPQRNFERRHIPGRGGAQSHRRRQTSGAVDVRCGFRNRLHQLPARRMGHRRYRCRLAKRPHDAPGFGFTAVSEKALKAAKSAKLPKSFFSWEEMLAPNAAGYFLTHPRQGCFTASRKRSTC